VQDAAYGTLLRGRRHELHRNIAEALETHFPETEQNQPELLAHHFTEAGLTERAVQFWLKAGQHALARSATTEAAALLRKGLTLVSSLPDTVWCQGHELDLQIALGKALMAVQGFGAPAVGEVYARAHQLCNELDQADKLLPILWGLWVQHLEHGDLRTAQQIAAEMRQVGETRGDAVMRVIGLVQAGLHACGRVTLRPRVHTLSTDWRSTNRRSGSHTRSRPPWMHSLIYWET